MIGVFFMDEREMINKKENEGTNPKEMELCQEAESVKEEIPQEKGKENKDVSENTDFISAGKKEELTEDNIFSTKEKKEPLNAVLEDNVQESTVSRPLKATSQKQIEKISVFFLFKNFAKKIKHTKSAIAGLNENRKRKMFIGVAVFVTIIIGIFLIRYQRLHDINKGEIPKYTVNQFVREINHVSETGEVLFLKGKIIQIYGPIVRLDANNVYMKSSDKFIQITLSSKTKKNIELSHIILGKNYKIEATISDAKGIDEQIYLTDGIFVIEEMSQR